MPTQRKGIRSQAELGTTIVKGLRIHFHHHHLVFYHYRSDRNAKPPIKMLRSRRGFIAKRCVILQFCRSRSRQCSVRLSEIHLTLKLLQEKFVRFEGTEPEPKKNPKEKECAEQAHKLREFPNVSPNLKLHALEEVLHQAEQILKS